MERYPVKGWLLTPSKFRGIKSDAEINPRVQYGMERVAAGIPDADAPCNRDYGLAGVQQSAEQHPQGWQQNCTTGSSHSKGASGWGHQEQEQGLFKGNHQLHSCSNVSAPDSAAAAAALATRRHSLRLWPQLDSTEFSSLPFPGPAVRIAVAGKPCKWGCHLHTLVSGFDFTFFLPPFLIEIAFAAFVCT